MKFNFWRMCIPISFGVVLTGCGPSVTPSAQSMDIERNRNDDTTNQSTRDNPTSAPVKNKEKTDSSNLKPIAYDLAQIAQRVLAGELSTEATTDAQNQSSFEVKTQTPDGYPVPVFYFEGRGGVYTFVLDNNQLVLLCSSWGGYAHSFSVEHQADSVTLLFQFDIGSGISHTYNGRYVLGSYQATTDYQSENPPIRPYKALPKSK